MTSWQKKKMYLLIQQTQDYSIPTSKKKLLIIY